MEIEKIRSYEVIELHKYKVILSIGERIISLPYIKTSAIIAIFLGTSGEFKDILKGIIISGGITVSEEIINKAFNLLNMDFAMNLREQLNEVINIVLDEYDKDGNLVKKGNCLMMQIEDIKKIIDIVIYDIGQVLKNVFGVEAKTIEQLPSLKKKIQ